jgi:hypothetical protein
MYNSLEDIKKKLGIDPTDLGIDPTEKMSDESLLWDSILLDYVERAEWFIEENSLDVTSDNKKKIAELSLIKADLLEYSLSNTKPELEQFQVGGSEGQNFKQKITTVKERREIIEMLRTSAYFALTGNDQPSSTDEVFQKTHIA